MRICVFVSTVQPKVRLGPFSLHIQSLWIYFHFFLYPCCPDIIEAYCCIVYEYNNSGYCVLMIQCHRPSWCMKRITLTSIGAPIHFSSLFKSIIIYSLEIMSRHSVSHPISKWPTIFIFDILFNSLMMDFILL